ncbi:stringent starvation protein SspA [Aliikangiella coralliicola]|uniref:Stringent starvation protein A n=1 Tax=Aliikangiella coralliicola TaxID=2592383 RepID=A0A545UK41_9GAMM|nr:stringent starvation protein SspA [Aliikangiella coralliicola]TQV89813.1 stringent starvation protein A [Aliikangiella coralliicola]
MATVAKRSIMTLYTGSDDVYSHQVRIVLAEKGVNFEAIEVVGNQQPPEDLIDLNPYNTVPTLVDRELVLFEAPIIMEYLDERFPHPPLMPVYPVARARSRLMMHRIEKDWYSLMNAILNGKEKEAEKSRKELTESLLTLAPVFSETPYFLSEEFSLIDCCLAPLMWRLPAMGIKLTGRGAKEVSSYMELLFERDSFQASLTDAERELRD